MKTARNLDRVSSKSDAEGAYTQAIIPIWNDEDKRACGEYNALVESADDSAIRLKELSDHHFLSALKTSKGKLTLKAIKTRFEKLDEGDEATTLTDYVDTDKQQKAVAKKAKEMLAEAESAIVACLSEDPLPENYSDLQVVVRYLSLLASQTELKSKHKAAVEALDKLAHDKYPELSVDEIKSLVVDDKWLPALAASVQDELDRVSQTLTRRIRQLAERYATPLPELTVELATLSSRVDEHLKEMGAVWN